jgi:hypothetical protein
MRRFLFAILLILSPLAVRAVSLVGEPEIDARETDATIRWKTDVQSGGKIRWGEVEGAADQTIKDGVADEHRITLPGLKPGTRYFFTVGTARDSIGKGSFVTTGAGVVPAKPVARSGGKGGVFVSPRPASPPPPAAPQIAPPTRATWGYMASLQDHYDRHGGDFNATSPDDYAAKAWVFREQAVSRRLPMKLDGDTVRVMDLRSRAFAAFNLNGTTKTYFRPRDVSYWERQPGTPISTPPWVR